MSCPLSSIQAWPDSANTFFSWYRCGNQLLLQARAANPTGFGIGKEYHVRFVGECRTEGEEKEVSLLVFSHRARSEANPSADKTRQTSLDMFFAKKQLH